MAARPTPRSRIGSAGSTRPRARSARRWTTAQIEEKRWIGDDVIRDWARRGWLGSTSTSNYGGQGLSQTGYARVFETFAQIDATLSIVMGVHQSIGFKGIHMFGSDDQKERFLPDLASGKQARRLRADRARGRLGRLQHPVARGPPAGRLVGA